MRRGRAWGLLLFFWFLGTAAAEELVFNLDWVPYGRDAGVYGARDQGFFTAQKLAVKFLKGQGSADSVKRLEVGTVHYAMPDAGVVILSRAKGAKVKLLGAYHDKSAQALFFLEESGIKSIKDLEGKRMGDAPWSSAHRVFRAVAEVNKLNMDTIKFTPMDPGVVPASLFAGKVDFVFLYIMNLPQMRAGAEQAGKKLRWWLYADFGVDTYGNSFAALDDRIQKDPDQVKRFVRAMMEGIGWAIENPERAVDLLLKENPTLNREIALEQWKITIDHLLTDVAAKKGIGHMDPAKVKFTRDIMLKAFNEKAEPRVEDLHTNDFLPTVFPKRR